MPDKGVIAKNNLRYLMRWAHARRNFFEAKELDPPFTEKVLALIGELYAVESPPDGQRKIEHQKLHDLRQVFRHAELFYRNKAQPLKKLQKKSVHILK